MELKLHSPDTRHSASSSDLSVLYGDFVSEEGVRVRSSLYWLVNMVN